MSASSSTFSAEHQYFSPSDQLCYVHCSCCDTVLAVSVPGSSLFKTVTVRCGHCSNLLSVNMRGLLIPASSPNQLHNHFTHSFFTAPEHLMEEIRSTPCQTTFIDQPKFYKELTMPIRAGDNNAISKPPVANRPPEKRQRVPSAYNRFIKEEIQRIKAGNPDISHREAFSAAAKNWAHYPHIHFGLMPDQPMKKSNIHQQQEGGDVLMKDEFFTTAAANGSLSPY